jgi:hypothetical protein
MLSVLISAKLDELFSNIDRNSERNLVFIKDRTYYCMPHFVLGSQGCVTKHAHSILHSASLSVLIVVKSAFDEISSKLANLYLHSNTKQNLLLPFLAACDLQLCMVNFIQQDKNKIKNIATAGPPWYKKPFPQTEIDNQLATGSSTCSLLLHNLYCLEFSHLWIFECNSRLARHGDSANPDPS